MDSVFCPPLVLSCASLQQADNVHPNLKKKILCWIIRFLLGELLVAQVLESRGAGEKCTRETSGSGRLSLPRKGNHVLCFEVVTIFSTGILEKKQKSHIILKR